MGIALTDEQNQAVTLRRGPLLLAAGAGSGKTSVLVERFVRAVQQDGVPPGRILAITFTERAAGELRQRVRDRFLALGSRAAARDLESAFLSTFHGFCVRLLRTHPLIAGLDPDFGVLEEGLAGHLRAIAFAGALRGFLSDGGDPALELLAAYGAERTQSMILDVYGELRSRGERHPLLAEPSLNWSLADALEALEHTITDAAGEIQMALNKRSGPRLLSALDGIELGRAMLLDGEPTDAERHPSQAELARMKLPGASSGVLADEACGAYRRALGDYTRACAERDGAHSCLLLSDLLERFGRTYEELKRARGMLDFDDLELGARDLLTADEQVRTSFSERFELLMVDEFQDSNPRQLEILAALERENLCTVGDEFQSIYGFRHADVSLFRARRERLREHGAVLSLARNFRGRAELLDVINTVFGARFGEEYTPLGVGREEPAEKNESGPLVELLLTDKRGWEEDSESEAGAIEDGADSTSIALWRVAEARLLAQRIADLIDAGEARAADFVVLLRGLGDVEVFEGALERLGIQTIAAVGGFWGHQQVEDLLAYLQALANPLDEIAIYSTLACPMVGLSSDGLALLALAARRSGLGVWETIKDTDGDLYSRLSGADRLSLERFGVRFAEERASALRRAIAEILERAIETSGYEEYVLGLRGGPRRLANIHKLLRIARSFESSQGRDLRAFLEHVAHLRDSRESSEPDAPVADEDLDAVRLMSIHAAKGLEFPIVCVADMGRAGNLRAPDLLIDAAGEGPVRLGLQLVSLDGSGSVGALDFEDLRLERQCAEAQEEERIVYVAMTRARERLLLSGAADFQRWPQEKPGSPAIGWVAAALIEDLPAHLNSAATESVQSVPRGDGAQVRCWLNTPANVGEVLRSGSGAPVDTSARVLSEEPRDTNSGAVRHPVCAQEMSRAQTLPELSREIFARQRTLSYSSLSQFERCGYSYYLRNVLGLPEDHTAPHSATSSAGVQGRSRGIIVHRLLESVDFERFRAPSVAQVLQAGSELGLSLTDGEGEELASFLGAISGSELFVRLAGAVSVSREQPFAFSVGPDQPLLTGVLDIVAHEPDGGWLIVDYKTDHVTQAQDLEALVDREYGLQRLLYGIAALRGGAPQTQVVHWFLERPDEGVGVSFSAAQTETLEEQLAGRIQRMQAAGFLVSQTPHRELCLTCPGRRGLCSWEEELTLRDSAECPPEQPVTIPGEDR